jgi:DNA primase
MHLAKEAAREKGVVIVEGYMDAIVAHQHGFSNVVASMGTALTEQQVALVHALVRGGGSQAAAQAVLALDPDAAGQEATLRSLESSWRVFQTRSLSRSRGPALYERREAVVLKVASLPQGRDPDEIILEDPAGWSRLMDGAVPLMDYLFTALASRLDLTTPQGKSRLAELLFPIIAGTPDPFQQDHYFQRLAALLGVSEAALQASLGRLKAAGGPRQDRAGAPRGTFAAGKRQEATSTPFSRMDHDPLEEYSLALALQHPQLLQGAPAESSGTQEDGEQGNAGGLRLEYFRRVENRELFTNLLKCSTLDALKERLDDEIGGHLDHLLARAMPPSDRKQRDAEFMYCVRRLEERYLRDLSREEGLRLSGVDPDEQGGRILAINDRLKHVLTDERPTNPMTRDTEGRPNA